MVTSKVRKFSAIASFRNNFRICNYLIVGVFALAVLVIDRSEVAV